MQPTKRTGYLKSAPLRSAQKKRGVKLGELFLKKAFWFAQANRYELVYITTYAEQSSLIDLLEFYGFRHTNTKPDGELIYEKTFSTAKLSPQAGISTFDLNRLNYPRFVTEPDIQAFGVPIKEDYHDTLYPELKAQPGLFEGSLFGPSQPGNTIRKVYLCRAKSMLSPPGSLLFFYKGKSIVPPSQAMTALGIFEDCQIAKSTKDLMHMAGGRSVYSEADLNAWGAARRIL